MNRFHHFSGLVALAMLLFAPNLASNAYAQGNQDIEAQSKPKPTHPFTTGSYTDKKNRSWAVIRANGITLFGIPVDAGGLTKEERATLIAGRLGAAYNKLLLSKVESYKIQRLRGETTVCLNNPEHKSNLATTLLVITIDQNFQKLLGRKAVDIAYYWRDLMKDNMKRAGIKTFSPDGKTEPMKDFLGRPLDPDATWMDIPEGYAAKTAGVSER